MEPQLFLLPDTDVPATDGPTDSEAGAASRPGLAETSLAERTPVSWRLDDRTRALGYQGIARARAALRDAATRTSQAEPVAPARQQPAA